MKDSSYSSEDQNFECNEAGKDETQKFSVGKNSTDSWIPDNICYTLAENLSGSETLQENEIKHGELINLLKENLRQSNVETMPCGILARSMLKIKSKSLSRIISKVLSLPRKEASNTVAYKDVTKKNMVAEKISSEKARIFMRTIEKRPEGITRTTRA